MSVDRRQFLRIAAAGVLASMTSTACADDDAANARELAHPALVSLLGPSGVRELGVRYRQMVPKEDGIGELRAALGHETRRLPWLPRRTVADRIREDFAEGRTVVVNGWVLSVTEARQCALLSLAPA
jgi:hypothetical protein